MSSQTSRSGKTWRHVEQACLVPIEGDVTVPATMWREHGDALSWRDGRTGLRLGPGDSLEALEPYLGRISMVVIETSGDDTPASSAHRRALRDRLHYAGEIRTLEGPSRGPRRVRGPSRGAPRRSPMSATRTDGARTTPGRAPRR